MKRIKKGLLERLYADEAVRFIAGRYHVTPQETVRHFLTQEGVAPASEEASTTFRLEENEKEIMRGLMEAYRSEEIDEQTNL